MFAESNLEVMSKQDDKFEDALSESVKDQADKAIEKLNPGSGCASDCGTTNPNPNGPNSSIGEPGSKHSYKIILVERLAQEIYLAFRGEAGRGAAMERMEVINRVAKQAALAFITKLSEAEPEVKPPYPHRDAY
jgi:hypothetical protein